MYILVIAVAYDTIYSLLDWEVAILNPSEREQMISILVVFTGWAESIFTKMSDEELEKIYIERVER